MAVRGDEVSAIVYEHPCLGNPKLTRSRIIELPGGMLDRSALDRKSSLSSSHITWRTSALRVRIAVAHLFLKPVSLLRAASNRPPKTNNGTNTSKTYLGSSVNMLPLAPLVQAQGHARTWSPCYRNRRTRQVHWRGSSDA